MRKDSRLDLLVVVPMAYDASTTHRTALCAREVPYLGSLRTEGKQANASREGSRMPQHDYSSNG